MRDHQKVSVFDARAYQVVGGFQIINRDMVSFGQGIKGFILFDFVGFIGEYQRRCKQHYHAKKYNFNFIVHPSSSSFIY